MQTEKIDFCENTTLKSLLATEDDAEVTFFVEVDSKLPDKKKQRQFFPIYQRPKQIGLSSFRDSLKNIMLSISEQVKKILL